MRERIYALYKGEKFLEEGTKKEIAAKRGCTVSTLSSLCSKSYLRRMERRKNKNKKGNYLILIKID